MKNNHKKSDAAKLLQKAEELLKKKPSQTASQLSEIETLKLIHELEVLKIELKLQNEELVLTRSNVQDATEKYIELYDFAPSGYVTLSAACKILKLNHASARMLGKEHLRLVNSDFRSFITEGTRLVFNDFLRKVFESNAKETCEVVLATSGGLSIYAHIEGIASENGKECLVTIVDITAQKGTLKLVETLYYQKNLILEAADEGIFGMDLAGNYTFVNPRAVELLGYNVEELLGGNSHELFHHHSWDGTLYPAEDYPFRETLLNEKPHYGEEYFWRKDKTGFPVEFSSLPIMEDHKITGAVVTFRDITARKQAEETLRASEARLNKTQEIAHLGSWELDTSTGKLILSDEVYRFFGLLPQEFPFTYKAFFDLVHPEDLDLVKSAHPSLVQEDKGGHEILHRIIRKNTGEVRYVSEIYEHIRDASGKIVRSVGTIQDITERKTTEQALIISQEKFRTTFNASPDGILLTDLKGIITDISEIGQELLGFNTKDDLLDKYFFEFVILEDINIMRQTFEKTMIEGIAQNIEVKIKKENGSLFLSEISTTLIQDLNGIPLSFMIIVHDISERKKIEARQIHADRLAHLGEMASSIAHEINQPLNIISLIMDKILFVYTNTETNDIEFFKNKSNAIFENITRIRNIIDHIRAFSRSYDNFAPTTFDINSSIENAISMISEHFKYLAVKLNLQLEKQIPRISGNTYKFEQVMLNLLANAKDAVIEKKSKQEEYFEGIVGIKSSQENQFIIVEITDNGIGISNDDINNIILPFYTTKGEGKGTGLGLTICYQIIKEMGGTLEITSDTFHGTKIKIII